MGIGDTFESEKKQREDLTMHADYPVYQLTNTHGYNLCQYFTHLSWIAGTNELLFTSNRLNTSEIFKIDVKTGQMVQLTENANVVPYSWAVSRDGRFMVYLGGENQEQFRRLDLESLDDELILERPVKYHGWSGSILDINYEDNDTFYSTCSKEFVPSNLFIGSISQGTLKPYFTEKESKTTFFDHQMLSPVDPNIMQLNKTPKKYVGQEAPQRMWLLNVEEHSMKPLYQQKRHWYSRAERVGHESWLPDGEHICFVVRRNEVKITDIDSPYGEEEVWTAGKGPNFWHVTASPEGNMLVADTMWEDTGIWLIEVKQGQKGRLFNLCKSETSWESKPARELADKHHLQAHPHPGFHPDQKYVQFTAFHESTGGIQLFAVDITKIKRSLPFAH